MHDIPVRYTSVKSIYDRAARARLVAIPDENAYARARRAYRDNLANPGDCKNDPALLIGLAIAQADIGMHPGWIPEVQRIGFDIANLLRPASNVRGNA